MCDFIDYVYCQGVDGYQTKHLFQADAGSGLEAGDIVFAAGCGSAAFNVLAVKTIVAPLAGAWIEICWSAKKAQ